MKNKKLLYDLTPVALQDWLKSINQPAYTSKQVLEWLYRHCCTSYDEMTNVSKQLREELARHYSLDLPKVLQRQCDSMDETEKYLFQLDDGETIETVLIPAYDNVKTDAATGKVQSQENASEEYTLCVSSQVGCQFACKFCASGKFGLVRNLTCGEIVAQVMAFLRQGKSVTHIVFMGMGEPLQNWDALRDAIDILTNEEAIGLSSRRITVSTVGLVPEIYRMAMEEWKVKLAISLHGATNDKRAELIPFAKAYALDQIFDALQFYQNRLKRRMTFEYLMIDEFNDHRKDADRLAGLCKNLLCHVNLIPYNAVKGTNYMPSTPERIEKFRRQLLSKGIDVTVRYSRGRNISAACGQLRRQRDLAATS